MSERTVAESAAREPAAVLERCRERIARRRADAPLFRTVLTVSRDEVVEACRSVSRGTCTTARPSGSGGTPPAG
ncbi:hypothetical protein [Streptomyces sediminimaris]|uniref:hypothetical protein n=1 Tax=Streptomyces sediminimaris TaxID=3383721 RepID=UPI00399B4356